MKAIDNLIKVYSGTELTADLLKGELASIGIPAFVRNGFQSGITGGFFGGTPYAIELFIRENDLTKAEPVINEFIKIN
jgi:Putative prokaryotic signal transducing protein